MISSELKKRLTETARCSGHGKALDQILAEARECVYFSNATQPMKGDDKPGVSRIGGYPDLPPEFPWPDGFDEAGHNLGPASFLAQINLSDLPEVDGLPLNRQGHLWFFRAIHKTTTEAVQVMYAPQRMKLAPRTPPIPKVKSRPPTATQAAPLRFEKGVSLPLYREAFLQTLHDLTGGKADWQKLRLWPEECTGAMGGYAYPTGVDIYRKIAFGQLGHPEAFWAGDWPSMEVLDAEISKVPFFIRDPAQEKTKLAAWRANLEAKRPHVAWMTQHREEINSEAARWQLLASFRENREAGLDLGDALAFELFVRSSDLAKHDFRTVIGEWPMVL